MDLFNRVSVYFYNARLLVYRIVDLSATTLLVLTAVSLVDTS